MAKNVTKAELIEQNERLEAMVTALMGKLEKAEKANKKQKPVKPWLATCPDYATDAQRVEYDKLANRARKQHDDAVKLFGTESVSCFIPVAKEQGRMPHSIKWTATYSK